MTCTVPKSERSDYAQELVLRYFEKVVGHAHVVTLGTSLGPDGIGHTPAKRKLYYYGIKEVLEHGIEDVFFQPRGCMMKTLSPNSFGDTKRYATVGDIATMVEKDLG